MEDRGHELAFEDWVILELVLEFSMLKSHTNKNIKTDRLCELSHKTSLSRAQEVESGNGEEISLGKGPDLLGRGVQKCSSQIAVGNR